MTTTDTEMLPGYPVRWAGVQDPRFAPGEHGTVLKIAYHDPNSICVMWDEGIHFGYKIKARYTWERRKNLAFTYPEGTAPVLAELSPKVN